MANIKIVYGIDLGLMNSSISKIENGEVKIIKSQDSQKDTTPSCVAFNKKGSVLVGDSAYRSYRADRLKALASNNTFNSFVEFRKTMGTDKSYFCPNINKNLSSEELTSEVIKRLIEYTNENVAAVIAVPATFTLNQNDATRRAAKLAGLDHVEILQEPIAAAMAYGLESNSKNGFWLVFNFDESTFDAALLKMEEGITKVIDTEGDNYLGGNNLDYAVVDQLIIPHIKENFEIDDLLKNESYRTALKFFAEELKDSLSFNESHSIYVDVGDFGDDDNGEEIEIDLTVTQAELATALSPIYQKAIDCCLRLLERNQLQNSTLDSLILVGKPTFSPILREMLTQQICKPDTSVDPMTVVSKGAAIFASTVDISEEVREKTRDVSKLQLEITHESTSVETEEFVTIKILEEKTQGLIPSKVYAEITRVDNKWSSGKVEIDAVGDVIDVQLNQGKTNVFNIVLFDEIGNHLEFEPSSFTIIQGSKIGSATMPYNLGIEVEDKTSGKYIFKKIKGLEKNASLPATGNITGIKSQKQMHPGNSQDFLKIAIYQGGYGADGTRAIYNEHVFDVIISGNDIPVLLPKNSDIQLTVKIDQSQKVTIEAFFPYLDHTTEIETPPENSQAIDTYWLDTEIKRAKKTLNHLIKVNAQKEDIGLIEIQTDLAQVESLFEINKNDIDIKNLVINKLRKHLKRIDAISESIKWPVLEELLKVEFFKLEKVNISLSNDESTQLIKQLKTQLDQVIIAKDEKLANTLLEEIQALFIEITSVCHLLNLIDDFKNKSYKNVRIDKGHVAQLLFRELQKTGIDPELKKIQSLINLLFNLYSF